MKQSNKNIVLILILSIQLNLFAQEIRVKNYPVDTLMPELVEIQNSSLSFLIQDNVYYNFYINEIIPLKNGYCIDCITKIDSFNVHAYVITNKIKIPFGNKIKQFETYKLCLNRYFAEPTVAGIHIYENLDIMLGDYTVQVGALGCFNYIFTSLNLYGLSFIDSIKVQKNIQKFEFEKNEIHKLVESFINTISFCQNSIKIFDLVDTNLIKQSINQYSESFSSRNISCFSSPNRLHPPFEVKLIDWNERFDINSNNFKSIFWFVIKLYYELPLESNIETNIISQSKIKLELLHLSKNGIYTVKVKWSIKDIEYFAILNILKIKQEFKVIGINRPI